VNEEGEIEERKKGWEEDDGAVEGVVILHVGVGKDVFLGVRGRFSESSFFVGWMRFADDGVMRSPDVFCEHADDARALDTSDSGEGHWRALTCKQDNDGAEGGAATGGMVNELCVG